MSILDEAQQLEEMTVIAKSLVKYAISLEPGIVFERQRGWWLATPEHNFVGFRFRWSGQVSIDLSLRGEPDEQFRQSGLVVRPARFGYSRCNVTSEDQLMAASVCIWRAHQLFHMERSREVGALLLADEHEVGREGWLRPRPEAAHPDEVVTVTRAEITAWYRDVREFMKANQLMDPLAPARAPESTTRPATPLGLAAVPSADRAIAPQDTAHRPPRPPIDGRPLESGENPRATRCETP